MGVVLSSLPIKEMAFSCCWVISRWRRCLTATQKMVHTWCPRSIHYQLHTGPSCGHGRQASEGWGCYLKADAFRDVASRTFKSSTMNRHRILIPGWFQPAPTFAIPEASPHCSCALSAQAPPEMNRYFQWLQVVTVNFNRRKWGSGIWPFWRVAVRTKE